VSDLLRLVSLTGSNKSTLGTDGAQYRAETGVTLKMAAKKKTAAKGKKVAVKAKKKK